MKETLGKKRTLYKEIRKTRHIINRVLKNSEKEEIS